MTRTVPGPANGSRAPTGSALPWKRATKAGAIVSMLASQAFLILLWTKAIVMPIKGIHNGVWAMILGVLLYIVVSLLTKPAPDEVVKKFFDLYDETPRRNH